MNDTNITVSIDGLIFDGLSVAHGQCSQIQAAVETELARLLASDGLSQDLMRGGALHTVPGGQIQLMSDIDPGDLGQQIARTVYSGIGGRETL